MHGTRGYTAEAEQRGTEDMTAPPGKQCEQERPDPLYHRPGGAHGRERVRHDEALDDIPHARKREQDDAQRAQSRVRLSCELPL